MYEVDAFEDGCIENADLEKKKKRRTKGLEFITLASKGCFCVCDTSVFSRSLFARSAFSRSAFSRSVVCVFETPIRGQILSYVSVVFFLAHNTKIYVWCKVSLESRFAFRL